MGNSSIKSSNKTNKKKKFFCCCNSSYSLSSFSNDEKYYPTFDRILSTNEQYSTSMNKSDKKHIYYCQSIEDLQKSLHGTTNINQWIDSLPILGTPSLYHIKTKQIECQLINDDNEQFEQILITNKSNREFLNLTKKFHLNFYLKDYLNRLKTSQIKQTFKNHFSSSKIIYPCNDTSQILVDDLNLLLISPPESILPTILINSNSSYKIHEQIRSKCYIIPLTKCKIEPNDDEYKQKSIELDRTHCVITLDSNKTIKMTETSTHIESLFIFVSNDLFQTGFIQINQEKITKEFLPFISYCSEENISYLSSNLIQQWFNTLLLVNQTCAIVKRFLIGNGNHMTCLLKEQMKHSSNKENTSSSSRTNLTFASLRLPSCTQQTDPQEETIIDAFSPVFLSDNKKISKNTIHIDYEQYSFGFVLCRWPKILIDSYYTNPNRYSKRQWPSKSHMNILINKSLLLIPNEHTHKWEINFDLIEENLFELMNESTLFFYILCQQLFSSTYSTRIIIKHCFLNYLERYGLPFSNNQNNILSLITKFLNDISHQINTKFISNYFNHEINLLNSNENYNQWFNYINKCFHDHIYLTTSPSLSIPISNRSIIIEFLFDFYRTFHLKRSEFYLNDKILLDLHKQLCENLSNDFLNNKQILDNIQMNLTYEFETNAELIHTCLNQIRKAQTSLIFHYTWTIFIQYIHTYYNVLWNID
ncbi:unnamed protein product [Adineta steineri]|uniref:Uncharacterized protein n=1 Tax=Adineta steineri TaxID=433720 RepID=A0A814X891_9BILA|nr:unnamed protein product [Adineta steineri]